MLHQRKSDQTGPTMQPMTYSTNLFIIAKRKLIWGHLSSHSIFPLAYCSSSAFGHHKLQRLQSERSLVKQRVDSHFAPLGRGLEGESGEDSGSGCENGVVVNWIERPELLLANNLLERTCLRCHATEHLHTIVRLSALRLRQLYCTIILSKTIKTTACY